MLNIGLHGNIDNLRPAGSIWGRDNQTLRITICDKTLQCF
jgi:hypothetical protein